MDKLDILIWTLGGGFLIIMASLKFIFNETKDIRNDLKEIRKDIQEVRTSLNRMEGAFYSKDCCMLKEETKRKAE